jgi:arylsulfatase A-like enzyme/Flp pilus assembly protein TadD
MADPQGMTMEKGRKIIDNLRRLFYHATMNNPRQQPSAETVRRSKKNLRRRLLASAATVLALLALVLLLRPVVARQRLLRQLPRCNVILLTLDTLRADHLSCYDAGRVQTPHLDALAAAGTLFEKCITQTPLTLPAHTSILSGTYPLYHQVRDNGGFLVPDRLELVSETLQRRRFATAGFIAAYVLHSKWGINQGFEQFSDDFDLAKYQSISLGKVQKRADEVLAEAEAWLRQNGNRRFFSWIHLYDPHTPYDPPSPFKEQYRGHPYRGEVAYMDSELGKFFDFLKREGLWDNTIIIACGDHGESFGEHREQGHGFFIYESTVHVPLIVRAPRPFPVQRVGRIVQLVDVAPTILDMLQVTPPAAVQGRSLFGLMLGRSEKGFDSAYCETYYPRLHFGWSELSALYSGKWKFIKAPRSELYDLAADPDEALNLERRQSVTARRQQRHLAEFQQRQGKLALTPSGTGKLDRDSLAKLAALGYITTTVDTSQKAGLVDPKEKIDLYNNLDEVKQLMGKEQLHEAVAKVEAIIASDGDMVDAHMMLGNLLFRQRQFRPALAAFREVLARRPDYNFAMLNILYCLKELGQWQECLREIEQFRTIFPDDPALFFEKGEALAALRRFEPALEALRRSRDLDPANARTWKKMGELFFLRGEYEQAAEHIRKGIAISPEQQKSHFDLAVIDETRGDAAAAEANYRRELEINARNFMASYNLAELLRKGGRADEALAFYRATIQSNPTFAIPYFMVAKFHFDRRQNLDEAVALCRSGVAITPVDKYTAFGYYILADIYGFKGERGLGEKYYRRAEALMAGLPGKKTE